MWLAKFFTAWVIYMESDDPEQNGYYSWPFTDKDKLTDSDINTGLKMLCERFGCDVIQLVGKQFVFTSIYPKLATGQAVKEFWTND